MDGATVPASNAVATERLLKRGTLVRPRLVKGLLLGSGVAMLALLGDIARPTHLWAASSAISHERLLTSVALQNAPGSRLTAVVVGYAPGEKSPAHHHAGSVFAYVLSGAIRSENSATGPARIYHAGDSFVEPVGSVHRVSENASLTQTASLLAVFVAPEGSQLTAPEAQ